METLLKKIDPIKIDRTLCKAKTLVFFVAMLAIGLVFIFKGAKK